MGLPARHDSGSLNLRPPSRGSGTASALRRGAIIFERAPAFSGAEWWGVLEYEMPRLGELEGLDLDVSRRGGCGRDICSW